MVDILLVEDDPALGRGLSVNLEHEGYSVRWVQDLRSAFRINAEKKLDLVILRTSTSQPPMRASSRTRLSPSCRMKRTRPVGTKTDETQAIGIISAKFHDLRATFITNLLARGESLARVMAIVGHTQIKTTNGYLRKAGVDVKGGTDKLGYGIPEVKPASVLQLVR